jgi:hypothetical protein
VDVANANWIGRTQNYTGNLADVFTCLATAVGVSGCGFEHQLQATRLALNPQRLTDGTDINMANVGFVRNKAYLAIILITDEDDCSAPVADAGNYGPNNDNMFLQRLPDETASMRCAMRGSLCNGAPIPGYDPVNGYTPVNGIPFSTPLSNCTAREPASPQDSTYLPHQQRLRQRGRYPQEAGSDFRVGHHRVAAEHGPEHGSIPDWQGCHLDSRIAEHSVGLHAHLHGSHSEVP